MNQTKKRGVHLDIASHVGAKKSLSLKHFKPELCYLTKTPPEGSDWIHEVKWDGYRMMAVIKKEKAGGRKSIKLITRNGLDWTDKFPSIEPALQELSVSNTVLDGELVVLDKKGISQFQLLQNFLKGESQYSLMYYVFDILFLDGYDIRNCALKDRKEILKTLFQNKKNNLTQIRFSDYVQGKGGFVYKKACRAGLEGIVSKDIHGIYEYRRSKSWLKSKCIQRQEFVIGGFTKPKGSREGFGSLLVGLYNDKKQLIYSGHVGTGFDRKSLNDLFKQLKDMTQENNPFYRLEDRSITNKVTWVKPQLVAELEFTEWTADHILRHPSFLGLRQDKPAKTVEAESMIKKKELKSKSKFKSKPRNGNKDNHDDLNEKINMLDIELSHPNKIIEITKSISKLELAEYYQKIAPWILPHIINRPLSLLRCPAGNTQKRNQACFYHKHYSKAFPSGVYPIDIQEQNDKSGSGRTNKVSSQKKKQYLYIKDTQGLIALVQLNVLEIHPWGSLQKHAEKPDRIIFDLDPGPDISWKALVEAALLMRRELTSLHLKSYIKTTGGKGLHIVLPLKPKYSWSELKNFSKSFARYLTEKYSSQFTDTITKSKRQGKILIDYLRNARGSTAVAPYSTRAKPGASISTPISWTELKKIQASDQFTVSNISQRLKKLKKDPWQGFFHCQQELPKI